MTDPAPDETPDQGPDSESSGPPPATLPAFTPVPRAAARSNGWKPEVQRAFIEALAETGSVKAACRRVARADHGAYMLRRHPDAQEFRRAWDAALDIGMRRIEDVAMERALHGVEVPVYSYGKLVGTRTVHNDRLLMFMLRNRAPDRFGAGRGNSGSQPRPNAVERMQLARLKKQWRQEWEAEHRAAEQAHEADALAEIDALLDTMRRNHFANMPAAARAHYRAYQIAMGEAPEDSRKTAWTAIGRTWTGRRMKGRTMKATGATGRERTTVRPRADHPAA